MKLRRHREMRIGTMTMTTMTMTKTLMMVYIVQTIPLGRTSLIVIPSFTTTTGRFPPFALVARFEKGGLVGDGEGKEDPTPLPDRECGNKSDTDWESIKASLSQIENALNKLDNKPVDSSFTKLVTGPDERFTKLDTKNCRQLGKARDQN